MAASAIQQLQRRVGRRIAELRVGRGDTQESFAEKLRLSTRYVQNVEQGRENLTLASLLRFADALDVSPSDLLAAPSVAAAGSTKKTRRAPRAHP